MRSNVREMVEAGVRRSNIILSVVMVLTMAFQASGQEQAGQPVYRTGDCWVFRSVKKNYSGQVSGDRAMPVDGEHKFCFLEDKFFQVSGAERREITSASPWASILPLKGSNRTLKFPLVVGKTSKEEHQDRVRGTSRYQRMITMARVVGVEDVRAEVGSYKTFKIEREDWANYGLGGKAVCFYSPETKSMIKYHYEALIGSSATWDVELIQYRPDDSGGIVRE